MAFISLVDIANQNRAPRAGVASENSILVSLHKATGNKIRPQINFAISSDICRKARVMPGDRMEVLFDPKMRAGLIRRVQSGGIAASLSGMKASKMKKGEFYRVNIKITYYEGMPLVTESGYCTDIYVTSEGIEFTFPDAVTFA